MRPPEEREGMWGDEDDEQSEYILISDISNKVLHLNKEVKLLEAMKQTETKKAELHKCFTTKPRSVTGFKSSLNALYSVDRTDALNIY